MKLYGGRALLNPPGAYSTAAIVAEVENTGRWRDGRNGRGDKLTEWNAEPRCTLQIANCDRSIRFEIDWQDEEDRDAALDKVDTMISTLADFRRGLKIEQRRYVKRAKELEDHDE